MKTAQDIILAPVITEKSMTDARDYKKFTFKVAVDANKIEIAKAVEAAFPGTVVAKVNTLKVRGHERRYGRFTGYTASWKKAIVTLAENSKSIEFFEGMM